MKRPLIGYVFVGALLLVAGAWQAKNSWNAVQLLLHPDQRSRWPFELATASPVIDAVQEEAARAGVQKGDVLLSANGHPYRGLVVMDQAVAASRPGDTLVVTVRSTGGAGVVEERTASIRLSQAQLPFSRLGNWLVLVVLYLGLPTLCLLLGFWAVAAQPQDPRHGCCWACFRVLADSLELGGCWTWGR